MKVQFQQEENIMKAKQFKKVVEENRKYIDIETRYKTVQMIFFVRDLMMESGNKECAKLIDNLADEIDKIDTHEIMKEHIF